MKRTRLTALATWMVEHLSFGLHNQALTGDLLEELQRGQSIAWLWRQVFSAIAAGGLSRLRDWMLPLIFCAGWSSLYRGWSFLSTALLAHAMPVGSGLAWPYSALLPLAYGMVPALTFVWLGLLVYVLSRPGILQGVTTRHLVWGLSMSLNVLLVSTVVLLRHFRDLHPLVRGDFYFAFHLMSISVPIALSLLVALSCLVTRTPRVMRRRRVSLLMGRTQGNVQSDPMVVTGGRA
jgi:hypothetical protein